MPSPVELAGCWGPRREPLPDCAARAQRFLDALARIDPVLASWYPKGRSPRPEGPRVARDRAALEQMLEAGRNRRDRDGEPFEELGCSLGLWNGASPSASLTVACGGWAGSSPNVALVSLSAGDGGPDLARFAAEGLRALVDAWDPDRASCVSDDLRDVQEDAGPGLEWAGWITYVRREEEPRVALPPGARLERWPNGVAVTLALPPDPIADEDLLAVRHALSQ